MARGGYGIFFVRVPQIYNSVIQTENGITDSHVFLNNSDYYDHRVFPNYPNPLVTCPLNGSNCTLPEGFYPGCDTRSVGLRTRLRHTTGATIQSDTGKGSCRTHDRLGRTAAFPPWSRTARSILQRLEDLFSRQLRFRATGQREVSGDPNQDGNDLNDRLPGYTRNAFTGPDYAAIDLRVTRTIRFRERYKVNLVPESFNLLNRDNQRVAITSNGMVATASTFVQSSVTANLAPYPGYYQLPNNFMKPNAAYAPRQVQLALKFVF